MRRIWIVFLGMLLSQTGFSQFTVNMAKSGVTKDYAVHIPVNVSGREFALQAQMNIADKLGLGLHGALITEGEEFDDKRFKEQKESLRTKGYQIGMMMARYTDAAELGGFYWQMGAGYRSFNAKYQRLQDAQYMSLARESIADENFEIHELDIQGPLFNARLGYRWVPASFPVTIGAYVGARHFQNTIKERNTEDSASMALSKEERRSLRNILTTTSELGLELGLAI